MPWPVHFIIGLLCAMLTGLVVAFVIAIITYPPGHDAISPPQPTTEVQKPDEDTTGGFGYGWKPFSKDGFGFGFEIAPGIYY